MELNLENKTYEESIELIKSILKEHPSIEVYTSAPITKDIFKKPNLEFSVNILYNKPEDHKFANAVDSLLYYVLVDYFATDEDTMTEDDYCTNVNIWTIDGTRSIAQFTRNDKETPYTLFKDGVYYE